MKKSKALWISGIIGFSIPYIFLILYLLRVFSPQTSFSYGLLALLLIPSLIFAGFYSFAGYLLSKKHIIWAILIYVLLPIISMILTFAIGLRGALI